MSGANKVITTKIRNRYLIVGDSEGPSVGLPESTTGDVLGLMIIQYSGALEEAAQQIRQRF